MRLRRGPLGVRRLERPVELRLPVAAERFLTDHGRLIRTDELIVRVRGGRVRAHWPSEGRSDTPPAFHGDARREPDGITLTGLIQETRASRSWALIYGLATGLMSVIVALGVYQAVDGTRGAHLPLLIGAFGATILGLSWRGARRDRRPGFDRQSAALEEGLRRWFGSGDGHRRSNV